MKLELDHFFILTDRPGEAGDLLLSMGLEESFSRNHRGQGTSNRRFEFSNGMLEILYLRDIDEANSGPARDLGFPERVRNRSASPFGIVLTRTEQSATGAPFDGWKYQPDYFEPPNAFHVGDNSEILDEPLCIYVPFIGPLNRPRETGRFKTFSKLRITVPLAELSHILRTVDMADRLRIESGSEHLAAVTLDNGAAGSSRDFRPDLPLIVDW